MAGLFEQRWSMLSIGGGPGPGRVCVQETPRGCRHHGATGVESMIVGDLQSLCRFRLVYARACGFQYRGFRCSVYLCVLSLASRWFGCAVYDTQSPTPHPLPYEVLFQQRWTRRRKKHVSVPQNLPPPPGPLIFLAFLLLCIYYVSNPPLHR